MYKCDKCGEFKWAVLIDKNKKSECFDCLETSEFNDLSVENIEPPLGWSGSFHQSEVMYQYGLIGTKRYKGKEN